MDDRKDSTTSSRLPNSNVSLQGNESNVNEIPVAPANFYSSNKPPPLPSRPIAIPTALGSGHTRYHAPYSPPTYRTAEGTPFREPELIADETISDEDALPELISQDGIHQQSAWYGGTTHWDPATLTHSSNSWEDRSWDAELAESRYDQDWSNLV